jgi:D-glycerate 3-kinase
LRQGLPTAIPAYDKSAFAGQGDRVPAEKWEVVNDVKHGQEKVRVVIFEGWCVGFRSRPEHEVRTLWEDAVRRGKEEDGIYEGRLGYVSLEDVMVVNQALREYDVFTESVFFWLHLSSFSPPPSIPDLYPATPHRPLISSEACHPEIECQN